MKTSEYLYGVEGKVFTDMKYKQALYYKMVKAREIIRELQKTPFCNRDDKRINDILKAIEFNRMLIEECEK